LSRDQGAKVGRSHKKEARSKSYEDPGEIQEVRDSYILKQKGLINKQGFYIPQNEVAMI
jgi:hypothetical protein